MYQVLCINWKQCPQGPTLFPGSRPGPHSCRKLCCLHYLEIKSRKYNNSQESSLLLMKEHKHPHEPPANAWCPPGWLLFCTRRSLQSPFPFLCAVDDGLCTLAQSHFWACLGTWVSFVLSGSCGYQPSIPGGKRFLVLGRRDSSTRNPIHPFLSSYPPLLWLFHSTHTTVLGFLCFSVSCSNFFMFCLN